MSAGPLAGLKVIELEGDNCAFAGKLMADLGADVRLIEAPRAEASASAAPGEEEVGRDTLWRWHYHTSKRGVTLDWSQGEGRDILRQLIAGADILLSGHAPGRLARLELGYSRLRRLNPGLIMVSVTPFGSADPQSRADTSDLSILAGGGPVWSCGYDDHSLPPVRGGGNQGYHTGAHFAIMSTLVALLSRNRTGRGQHIDVNMHAAANVTTEAGSYTWLVSRETVQRQTGRHAGVRPTMNTQIQCADGRYVMTGIPPRTPAQFRSVYEWLTELGLAAEFDQAAILEVGMADSSPLRLERGADDPDTRAKLAAGRDALNLIAANLSAYAFFTGAQERGFQIGIINSPEEMFEDPHFKARGFQVEVEHPELGKTFRYPGAPIRFTKSPWRIRRRAPLFGEDNAAVYAELGLNAETLAKLRAEGVI